MKLTGSEIVADMLAKEGVPYAIGIPGHGNLALVDAFRRYQDRIQIIMPRHEQAAVHMADGYYRVKGEPLAVFTSIGAGASNTTIDLAEANSGITRYRLRYEASSSTVPSGAMTVRRIALGMGVPSLRRGGLAS